MQQNSFGFHVVSVPFFLGMMIDGTPCTLPLGMEAAACIAEASASASAGSDACWVLQMEAAPVSSYAARDHARRPAGERGVGERQAGRQSHGRPPCAAIASHALLLDHSILECS